MHSRKKVVTKMPLYTGSFKPKLFKDPIQIFEEHPLLTDTRYRPDKYCPIPQKSFNNSGEYMIFAGISYLWKDDKLVDPKIICIAHNPKAVEFFMFGCRQYYCLRSILSNDPFDWPNDHDMEYRGVGIIRCASFRDKDDFLQFVVDYNLEGYLMEPWAYLNQELCGYLPDNKKVRIPRILIKIIDRQLETVDATLQRIWDDMRHLSYYFNIAYRYPHSSLEVTKAFSKDAADTIFNATQYVAALLPSNMIPFHMKDRVPTNDTCKEELDTLNYDLYVKMIKGSNPIFFAGEKEYRSEIRCEEESEQMDRDYRNRIAPSCDEI